MSAPTPPAETSGPTGGSSRNFIQQIIDADRAAGKNGGRVHTRFPPEPNGYLHIGHAKSICLNYGLAKEYGGKFNLRFDDTNPAKEEQEYVDSIVDDVDWFVSAFANDQRVESFLTSARSAPLFASHYFDHLHASSVELV